MTTIIVMKKTDFLCRYFIQINSKQSMVKSNCPIMMMIYIYLACPDCPFKPRKAVTENIYDIYRRKLTTSASYRSVVKHRLYLHNNFLKSFLSHTSNSYDIYENCFIGVRNLQRLLYHHICDVSDYLLPGSYYLPFGSGYLC
jgi:hypothetical protein